MLQYINLMSFILLAGLCIGFIKRHKEIGLYAVPALTWALHGVLFYFVEYLKLNLNMINIDLIPWSAGLRLHAITMTILYLVWHGGRYANRHK